MLAFTKIGCFEYPITTYRDGDRIFFVYVHRYQSYWIVFLQGIGILIVIMVIIVACYTKSVDPDQC